MAPVKAAFLAWESLNMPNDAKLGFVVGVGVVIAIAVVFFRKDGGPAPPLKTEPAAAVVNSPQPGAGAPSPASSRNVKARPTSQPVAAHEGEDTP
jgi:hypothetical protein